jgi:hypothetical protein
MKLAKDGIVLQKMRQRFGVGEIVGGDKLNAGMMQTCAQHIAADTAEAVNAYFNGHAPPGSIAA